MPSAFSTTTRLCYTSAVYSRMTKLRVLFKSSTKMGQLMSGLPFIPRLLGISVNLIPWVIIRNLILVSTLDQRSFFTGKLMNFQGIRQLNMPETAVYNVSWNDDVKMYEIYTQSLANDGRIMFSYNFT